MTTTHRRNSSIDPLSTPELYYGPSNNPAKAAKGTTLTRTRTMSTIDNDSLFKTALSAELKGFVKRRGSEDAAYYSKNRKFFINDVDATLQRLLDREDTDQNFQITIEDTGPKVLTVGTANSNGYRQAAIRGTYMLSNLLQELTIARNFGRRQIILDEARLNENPVDRLYRMISTQFWKNLTRRMDGSNIGVIAADTKIDKPGAENPRIYIPHDCPDQFEFYVHVSTLNPSLRLEVEYLPKDITPEYVMSLNERPGILALAMESVHDPSTGEETLVGFPYVVPGGRFNELYGWDSYMIALGLLENNNIEPARGMVENFMFEIDHYGKILNANRSYYLCRSQPPFLTDMVIKVFKKMGGDANPVAVDMLKRGFSSAVKEYKHVWHCAPRLDEATGLSCYHPDGKGIPPETESSHFDSLLRPYANECGVSIEDYKELYNSGKVKSPELDEFFLNDRGVRESGHDTSYRLDAVCAHMATIDLNSLLYKYEVDIADYIKNYANNSFTDCDGETWSSEQWMELAEKRRAAATKYLWNEEKGMFFDYNVVTRTQSAYESSTTFWAMWSGMCTQQQADAMVLHALPKLEELGGLVAGTEESRGEISLDRPSRQWDYPFGWAPQQILAWVGFENYGYTNITKRLAYRWLYLMTKAFVDYNGIVVEKYDVTKNTDPHRVDAEYGNQGADFKGVATEGFGWVNASFVVGLNYLDSHARRALGTCTEPDVFFKNLRPEEKHSYGLI